MMVIRVVVERFFFVVIFVVNFLSYGVSYVAVVVYEFVVIVCSCVTGRI